MKIKRHHFNSEFYRLWELGLILPIPRMSSVYNVKFTFEGKDPDNYDRICLKAVSVNDALERSCFNSTYGTCYRPEEVFLHSVYDEEDNLLWVDESYCNIVQKKYEFRGMERREFLKRFGATAAAILYGLKPSLSYGVIPFGFVRSIKIPNGEQLYTSVGSFNWTVPVSVPKVNVVCVGGGGGMSISSDSYGSSGAGLGWKNNISVSPGSSISVVVGASGNATNAGVSGDSYFSSTSVVAGLAGPRSSNVGGNYVGDGGGAGGGGGTKNGSWYGGGGGAGGYSGTGGKGGNGGAYSGTVGTPIAGSDGQGGGAGGGIGGGSALGAGQRGAWGGGVGLYGQGSNGLGGTSVNTNGGNGSVLAGYAYGAGALQDNFSPGGYDGNPGAVRIMWGTGRSFPSKAT